MLHSALHFKRRRLHEFNWFFQIYSIYVDGKNRGIAYSFLPILSAIGSFPRDVFVYAVYCFLYCVLFAVRLFAIGVKDLIIPTGYLALAVYVQPFYKFWDIYKVGRDHALYFASWGHAYTLQHCGEAMIVLLILSYIEEVGRRR